MITSFKSLEKRKAEEADALEPTTFYINLVRSPRLIETSYVSGIYLTKLRWI